MIPILFGVTLVTFLLFNVAGGDPAAQAAGRYATAEQIQAIRAEMGLDQPLITQLFHTGEADFYARLGPLMVVQAADFVAD